MFRKKKRCCMLALLLFVTCLVFLAYDWHSIQTHQFRDVFMGVHRELIFNINVNVLAFVHMQKTGGSDFDRHIVRHLLVNKSGVWEKACKSIHNNSRQALNLDSTTKDPKRKKFKNFVCPHDVSSDAAQISNWYFSRQTFGWICGLHADYMELQHCVPTFYPGVTHQHIYYLTILRDPVRRFLSEWRHVARGATWKRQRNHRCPVQVDTCYRDIGTWMNVSLGEFIACRSNMANNRQVRMLAEYEFNEECETRLSTLTEVDLLTSAKRTLHSLAFFALNEYQLLSQRLFEVSFGQSLFRFDSDMIQSNETIAESFLNELSSETVSRIEQLNHLDKQLYDYAREVFFKRVDFHKIQKNLAS